MKKLNSKTLALHFLFFLWTIFPAVSQVTFTVDNNQIQNVYTHLQTTYQSLVQIDSITLQTHLNGLIDLENYDPNLSAPRPNIMDLTSTAVEFTWPDISAADSYRIEYINLENGTTAYLTSTNTEITVNSLSSAPYLFSFISFSDTDRGKVNCLVVDLEISPIIVDTEILLQGPLADELSCDCTPLDTIDSANQTNIVTTATIPWQTTTGIQKYQLDISIASASGSYASSLYFIQETAGSTTNTYFLSLCDTYYSSAKPYLFGIPNVVEATISTEGMHLYFPDDSLISYTVQAKLCNKNSSPRSVTKEGILKAAKNNISSVNVFPNPVANNQVLQVNFELSATASTSIYLYNSLGQRVRVISEKEYLDAGYHEKHIDVSTLPKGKFYWTLKTDAELYSSHFLKVE